LNFFFLKNLNPNSPPPHPRQLLSLTLFLSWNWAGITPIHNCRLKPTILPTNRGPDIIMARNAAAIAAVGVARDNIIAGEGLTFLGMF